MSFMHGAQAGQKFIGVFLLGIMISGKSITTNTSIPIWLMIYAAILIYLGTLIGGYKTIKTVGEKMSKLELYQGTVVDFSTSLCMFISSSFGIPISTSHTKALATAGVLANRKKSSLNFNIIKNILLAGVITIPSCIAISYIITKIIVLII